MRYSPEEIFEFHKLEKDANEGWTPCCGRQHWLEATRDISAILRDKYKSFWNPKSTIEWREIQSNIFRREIWKLWRPIWDKRDRSYDLMPGDSGYISELEAIHECDLAIYKIFQGRFPPAWDGVSSGLASEFKSSNANQPESPEFES